MPKTLKKEKGFSKDQLADLNWPTHVAALDDSHVYIRDNNGVHLFDPTTTSPEFNRGNRRSDKKQNGGNSPESIRRNQQQSAGD